MEQGIGLAEKMQERNRGIEKFEKMKSGLKIWKGMLR